MKVCSSQLKVKTTNFGTRQMVISISNREVITDAILLPILIYYLYSCILIYQHCSAGVSEVST